jgi:hypothetical protein
MRVLSQAEIARFTKSELHALLQANCRTCLRIRRSCARRTSICVISALLSCGRSSGRAKLCR